MKTHCKNNITRSALRIASLVLALCMALTMLPGLTVSAATYQLWVGGEQVTSTNAASLLGGKASYNASTNTLTLDGASITTGIGVYDSDAHAAIYSEGNLNLVIKGSNAIRVNGYAAAVDGALTISGSGTLTATTTGEQFSGIFTAGNLTMNSGTVTLNSTGTDCIGLWVCGDTAISGGQLSASATGNGAIAILGESDITVNAGTVSAIASGRESWGMVAADSIKLGSGSITATATGDYTTGLCAASLDIAAGDFEARGGECAVYLDSAAITTGAGYTFKEGSSSPGSTVTKFTNASTISGTFISKPYISAVNHLDIVRLGGSTRVETSVLIAEHGWDKADNVVLATAFNFADALSGVPLAYALDAPILLINGKTVDDSVMRQISALGAKNVYLLGGEGAISKEAFRQLDDNGLEVTRLAGASRYGTAVEIAKKLSEITGKTPTSAFFTYGYDFPDALAISSAAAISGTPILYVPKTGKLDAVTDAYLDSLSLSNAVVLGGEAAVSAGVYNSIEEHAADIERISGATRYETAVSIIRKYSSVYTSTGIAIATGTNYPDALAGAALAAREGMAVMLVPTTLASGSNLATQLRGLLGSTTTPIYIFGGTGAVSDDVIDTLLK